MAGQTIAASLAEWTATLDTRSVPEAAKYAARRAILDAIGVITAGRHHQATKRAQAAFGEDEGHCSMAGGGHTSGTSAALINGTAAHAYDMDDTSYTGIMHGSAVIVPAILATVDETGADDSTALAAFVAGSEATYVLADMATHAHYFRGWWSTLTFGLVGAAAAAARIYKLSPTQTRHSIALAAASAAGCRSVFGCDAKPFLVGEAARRAVDFARAARSGVTGPADIFEAPRGFFALLNNGECSSGEIATLGQRWRLVEPGLLFKLYPVCSAAHALIEQTAVLCQDAGATAAEIAAIECYVPHLVGISLIHDNPRNLQEAQFSLPYAVACAVRHGGVRLEDISDTAIHDGITRDVMAKVAKAVDPALSTDEMRKKFPESARVKIKFTNGTNREAFCGEAYGMPGRPLSDRDLADKFTRCARFGDASDASIASALEKLTAFGAQDRRTLADCTQQLWSRT